MAFFLRSASLQIGPLKYSMDDGFYFDFDVPFYDSEQLTTASFTKAVRTPASRFRLAESCLPFGRRPWGPGLC